MSKRAKSRKRPSIVYSAVVVVGLLLTVLGATVAILGISSSGLIVVSISDVRVKTSSVGLAMMVVGAVISVAVAIGKPRDVQLFSPELALPAPGRAVDLVARAQAGVALLALVALAVSVFA